MSPTPTHQGQAQTGADQGQQQGGQQQPGGPPTNEQLIQFVMLSKGLNREDAGKEVGTDPDSVKQTFLKVKQMMQSLGGQPGQQPSGHSS